MRRAKSLTALVSAAALLAGLSLAASRKAVPEVPSRAFQFTSVVHVPALPAGSRALKLWLPLPYEDAHQSVTQLTITSPVPYRLEREPEYGDRYAYLVVHGAKQGPFDIKVSFHVRRFEYKVSLAPLAQPSSAPRVQLTRFLQPDRLVPLGGKIADLSREQTDGATQPLDKARKIYDYVIATMHYDHDGTEWGRGDALWACDAKHGNCTDFHSLFIAMARDAGIPARFEIGFSLSPDTHEASLTSYHCWAEFYVDGIGWIPVDASEAWKHKEKANYFFGAVDTNRLMMTLGRDIHLRPAQAEAPLNYSVYPYAELDGKAFTEIKSEYKFQDDPVPAEPASSAKGD